MIKQTNCEGCFSCVRALPQVFSESMGSVRIDQAEGDKVIKRLGKEAIEACCPHGYLEVSNATK
jgi:ferredoxin